MSLRFALILNSSVMALMIFPNQIAQAAEPTVPMGRAASFAVVAGSGVVSTNGTLIVGNAGVWPGITLLGFPPGIIRGSRHTADVAAADAQVDLTIAYNDAAARSTSPVIVSGDIGGQTLTPGVYRSTSSLDITSGNLILDGRSNQTAVYIFQIPSTFTVSSGRSVILTNGVRSSRVFWQVGTSAILQPNCVVKGNILADQSIDIQSGARVNGRALARNGTVTLDASSVRLPTVGPGPPPTGVIDVTELIPSALNPQTGLFEQTIQVCNTGSNAVAAADVRLKGLPTDVTVYNRNGQTTNGRPFIRYGLPMAVGDCVELVIEYFRASRQPFASPVFVSKASDPLLGAVLVETRQEVLRTLPLGPGRVLIEFKAIPGRRYAVQYSDDGSIWKTAQPPITAPVNRILWLDDGPPKTESKPTGSRSYRVLRLL